MLTSPGVQPVAGGLFAVDLYVEVRLANDPVGDEIGDAPYLADDLLDLHCDGIQLDEVGAYDLYRVLPANP